MQQAGDVMIVITNVEALRDEIADHRPSPDARLVAGLDGTQLDDGRQRISLRLSHLRRRSLRDSGPQPFDVVRVVPLKPAVHAASSDAGLRRDCRDFPTIDIRADRTPPPPFGEVVLSLRLDDEGVKLLELSRATARAADGMTSLCVRQDRVTMIPSSEVVKSGSQAARSCLETRLRTIFSHWVGST